MPVATSCRTATSTVGAFQFRHESVALDLEACFFVMAPSPLVGRISRNLRMVLTEPSGYESSNHYFTAVPPDFAATTNHLGGSPPSKKLDTSGIFSLKFFGSESYPCRVYRKNPTLARHL